MKFDYLGVINRILRGHFDGFWRLYQEKFLVASRHDIEEMIQKAIRCDSRNVGHIRYECLDCSSYTRLFSCKSWLCNKCVKQYTDDWSHKQQELIFNVPHLHETTDLFIMYFNISDPRISELLVFLVYTVAEVIKRRAKRCTCMSLYELNSYRCV